MKATQVSKLRSKHSQTKEAEWETVLLATLLRQGFSGQKVERLEKLEVIATITGDQLVVIFRKNISGITQRLGEISLTRDEDLEISTLDWTSTAIIRSHALEEEVQDLKSKYDAQAEMIKKLNRELEDLIQDKAKHENTLLEKFREILNKKKLQVRDQQRLLAEAKLGPIKSITSTTPSPAIHYLTTIPASRIPGGNSSPRIPTASRSSKRIAAAAPTESDSSDAGFEKMAVDGQSPVATEGEAPATPEKSDLDATEDDDDDLDTAPPLSLARLGRIGGGAKGEVRESRTTRKKQEEGPNSPPPRRELPFAANKGGIVDGNPAGVGSTVETATANNVPDVDDEDEDSDDEL